MAYSDVLNKVSQIKLNNLNLILAKLRQGDGGSPYTAPPKEETGPFVPAPKKDVANITPKDFSPPPIRYIPHIRIPSIKEAEMKHFKNFIESMGGSTEGLSKINNSMMIAGLPYTPPVEKMVIGKKLMDSPLRFRSDADRIRLMEDYAKGFRYDGT